MQIFVYTCIRKAMAEMNVMAEMKQKSTMRSILYHFLIIDELINADCNRIICVYSSPILQNTYSMYGYYF